MELPDSISSYLREFSTELSDQILASFPPLHGPTDVPSPVLAQLYRRPFKAQEMAVMGAVRRLQRARSATIVVTFSKSWPKRPGFGLTGTGHFMV